MKASQLVALPIAVAAVSLLAVPSQGQSAKRNPNKAPNAQQKALKQRALLDTNIHAFRADGTRMIAAEGTLAGAPLVNECFNAFADGPVNGQFGWTTFTATQNGPVISGVAPLEGAKSVELPDSPAVANGTFSGIFSPNVGAQPAGQYTCSYKVMVPNFGGADYDGVFQAPSQAFLTNRVKFYYTDFDGDGFEGDILILDDPDNAGPTALAFFDSGADWVPGVTHDVRIEVDATANTQRYFLDGTLIYTGTVYAGTSIEQAVILDDTFHLPGEIGRTDCVVFEPGVSAGCLADIAPAAGDGQVNVSDLLAVITSWGACPAPPATCDADIAPAGGDGQVNVSDLLAVITSWGACP